MAGIGLRLRNLVADQTYLHGAAAYFSSGVIAAGPWLISVISLALLQGVVGGFLPGDDRMVLFATITYVFVGSSILTGPVQIVLTRIAADRIFLHETNVIGPIFTRSFIMWLVAVACIAVPFVLWTPFELPYRLLAGSLFVTVSLIWLVLAVISAAQDYVSLMLAFLLGYAISGGAAVALGRLYSLSGAMAGFTLGQAVCLALLINRVYIEFPSPAPAEIPLGRWWWEYRGLAVIGLLYSAGLWADKLFYWLSPMASVLGGFFRTFPAYDSAVLLAYLLTIPASAVFLLNIETSFYQYYRAYYLHVLKKPARSGRRAPQGTLKEINRARLAMIRAVRSGLWTLLKVQGMIAAFACLLAPDLTQIVGLPPDHLLTFRVAVLAAGGQVFVLYAVLLLLYLDARRLALVTALIFFASNLSLTILAYLLLPGIYGAGYLLSTLIASLVGLHLLDRRMSELNYLTFMLQPLT